MALSTVALIEAGVTDLFASLKDAKEREPAAFNAVLTLQEVLAVIRKLYTPEVAVSLTDSTDAGVSEAIAATGELGIAWAAAFTGETTCPIGATFSIDSANDFTDNALATAKGSAVADGDIFQVTGADAVTYLGAAQPDFSADEPADF